MDSADIIIYTRVHSQHFRRLSIELWAPRKNVFRFIGFPNATKHSKTIEINRFTGTLK